MRLCLPIVDDGDREIDSAHIQCPEELGCVFVSFSVLCPIMLLILIMTLMASSWPDWLCGCTERNSDHLEIQIFRIYFTTKYWLSFFNNLADKVVGCFFFNQLLIKTRICSLCELTSSTRSQSQERMHSVVCADFLFWIFSLCLMVVNPVKSGTVRWNWILKSTRFRSPSRAERWWYWHYRDT